jgi:hypothetical protein
MRAFDKHPCIEGHSQRPRHPQLQPKKRVQRCHSRICARRSACAGPLPPACTGTRAGCSAPQSAAGQPVWQDRAPRAASASCRHNPAHAECVTAGSKRERTQITKRFFTQARPGQALAQLRALPRPLCSTARTHVFGGEDALRRLQERLALLQPPGLTHDVRGQADLRQAHLHVVRAQDLWVADDTHTAFITSPLRPRWRCPRAGHAPPSARSALLPSPSRSSPLPAAPFLAAHPRHVLHGPPEQRLGLVRPLSGHVAAQLQAHVAREGT